MCSFAIGSLKTYSPEMRGFVQMTFGIQIGVIFHGMFVLRCTIWKNSYVMIPDGCQALITRYGKVEETVGPGRKTFIKASGIPSNWPRPNTFFPGCNHLAFLNG